MSEPLLKVRHLKKYFPVTSGLLKRVTGHVHALDDVSFDLPKGKVVGVVGETGSGKSTLGRCVLRLIEPTSGEVEFEGKNLLKFDSSNMFTFRKEAQIIFQDPYASLNPRKSVRDSIGESLLLHGIVKDHHEQNEHVAEILRSVGLSPDMMMRYPHQFSGGQQQRICIGRAIACQPKFIVCDEAVSALDVSVQAQILNLLQELKEKLGLSYLFISHDLSTIKYLSDEVIVLYLGKVMERASVQELFSDPKHPYTQALLSSIPKSHPSQKPTRIALKGEIPSALSPPSGCPFRTRCPYAQPVCAKTPPKKVIGNDHEYHCILPLES